MDDVQQELRILLRPRWFMPIGSREGPVSRTEQRSLTKGYDTALPYSSIAPLMKPSPAMRLIGIAELTRTLGQQDLVTRIEPRQGPWLLVEHGRTAGEERDAVVRALSPPSVMGVAKSDPSRRENISIPSWGGIA
ncbi:MAG: hypothetical protein IPG74_15395 [Flavobacteriales bacterium]|nr:hypothetical protein [Flavobacteriales bacterium]